MYTVKKEAETQGLGLTEATKEAAKFSNVFPGASSTIRRVIEWAAAPAVSGSSKQKGPTIEEQQMVTKTESTDHLDFADARELIYASPSGQPEYFDDRESAIIIAHGALALRLNE